MKIEIVSRLLNFFFPSRCMFCDNFVPYKEYVCKTCESRVVEGGYITNIPIKTCTTLIFAFYYHLVTNSVYKLKLSHDRYSAKALAHFLSKAVDNNIDIKKIDVIISSPKYFNKRCRNKFNHAHVLAKEVADVLGVFYAPNVLVKIKKTSKQHTLGKTMRSVNLKNAFEVSNKDIICNKTILLIDDVFTTGATISECSAALINAGAKKVIAACAAKTNNYDKS